MSAFWRTLLDVFNPFKYAELAKRNQGEVVKYVLLMYSLCFGIALLLSLPALIHAPTAVQDQLAKAKAFSLDVEFNASETIMFPATNPWITISENDTTTKAKLMINKYNILVTYLPGMQKSYDIQVFKDFKKNSDKISNLILWLIILMSPTLVVLLYSFHLVKFALLAFIVAGVAKIAIGLSGKKAKFGRLFNASLYSLTLLIIIEAFVIPLNIRAYYIPLVLYIIWYAVITMELVEDF